MCDAVDIDSFRKFAKKHPALLFPAFEVQRKMQDHTMGQRYWASLANKRLKLSSGQYVPIKQYMELHLNELVREDREKIKNSVDNAKDAARGSTGPRRYSKERRKSKDQEAVAVAVQIVGASPDHVHRNTKERQKSRDMTNHGADHKDPEDYVKDAIAAMKAASTAHAIPQTQPDRGSVKNRNGTNDRESVKADAKRRKTLDTIQKQPSLTQLSLLTSSALNAQASQGAPETYKGVSNISRQRRKSTMDAQLPSQRNGGDAPDIYDALLALSREVGGKSDDRRKTNFEKMLAKNARKSLFRLRMPILSHILQPFTEINPE